MELTDLLNEKEWRKCKGPENATTEELVAAFSHFCSTTGILDILSVVVSSLTCVKRKLKLLNVGLKTDTRLC
jgi:hypothetical protein